MNEGCILFCCPIDFLKNEVSVVFTVGCNIKLNNLFRRPELLYLATLRFYQEFRKVLQEAAAPFNIIIPVITLKCGIKSI